MTSAALRAAIDRAASDRVASDRVVSDREAGPFLLIGVHDLLSALLAAQYETGLFVSGAGLSASLLGLPDIGFITADQIVEFVRQVTTVLDSPILVVDVDDGFGGPETAAGVVARLASLGASAVVIEDQARPRRFGHLGGSSVVPLERQLQKLDTIRRRAPEILVIARTDATEPAEILRRVTAFVESGIEAVLVAGVRDARVVTQVRAVAGLRYLVFDRVVRNDRPTFSRAELGALGVDVCMSSTVSIDAAFASVQQAFRVLAAEWHRPMSERPAESWLALTNAILEKHQAGPKGNRIVAPPTYAEEP